MRPVQRVDFFVTGLRAGGNARSTTILANEFVARGYDTRMVTLNLENAFYREHIHPSIPVTSFDTIHVREALGGLAAYLRESQPQVILSQYSYLTVALVLLRELHGFPTKIIGVERGNLRYVRREHATKLWRGRVVPALIRQFYCRADHIVGVSEGTAQELREELRCADGRISAIYNAIDPVLAAQAAALIGTPDLTALKSGRDLYAIGRLMYQKGFDRLLNAFALCLRQRPELRLHMVGDGPLREELQAQAAQLGIAHAVTWQGFTQQIGAIYQQATLVVMSSHYEAMPLTPIEATSFGTPVVAFDCTHGPSEVIINGVNGFLVPQDDVPALAQTILHALDYAWDAAQIVATAQRFSKERTVDSYEALFARLMG